MPADQPTIVASSIGFRSMNLAEFDWEAGPVYRYAAELANASSAPKLCIVATALGDDPAYLTAMYAAFGRAGFRVTHLSLFPQPNTTDIASMLGEQDVVWVAGGSVANLLAVWSAHDLGPVLRDCWQAGVVLSGVSAGSVCWFTGGTTDSFGLPLRPVTNGLGFLPYSNSPHHDAEAERRPAITSLLAAAALPDCYATDNGAAVTFFGTEFHEAVSDTATSTAWFLHAEPGGAVTEERISTRLLL